MMSAISVALVAFVSALAGLRPGGTLVTMGFYQEHIVPHLVSLAMRNRELAPYRERILSQANGLVLEIGVGSGANLPLYTDRAAEILGLEPHPKLLKMASRKVSPITARLIEASAESIPLDARAIDTVVVTWTLCTIPDVRRALTEMRRVLKPDGQLLFVEHGLSPDGRVRNWQNRLNPIWKRIAGGCHLNRPMRTLIEEAGFRISRLETGYMTGPKPMTFMYEGAARPA
jgi:ubiquinone/menaquinone biosynthesis C-methylase UbiE